MMSELNQIRWHCRRGSLELDLILQKFADAYLARLDTVQRDAFNALLECDDADLIDLITGHAQAMQTITPAQREIVARLRAL